MGLIRFVTDCWINNDDFCSWPNIRSGIAKHSSQTLMSNIRCWKFECSPTSLDQNVRCWIPNVETFVICTLDRILESTIHASSMYVRRYTKRSTRSHRTFDLT
jgi:hypothetical protein